MLNEINVYCDESCHLEHNHHTVMVLGAIWCLKGLCSDINQRVREIKERNQLSRSFEIKWDKVSPAKYDFYLDILDYFFDDDDLHFRGIIIDKAKLDHLAFHQTHDTWYYKMLFTLLNVIIIPSNRYNIYLDYKDTWSYQKAMKLYDVISNAKYDYSREIINKIQPIRSYEAEILQLTDLLIGIISYLNRGLTGSKAKTDLVERMKERSNYSLTETTLLREDKVNILRWPPDEVI
jgi:hypothetical protein